MNVNIDASKFPVPKDMKAASRKLKAMCGHGALAAALGVSVTEAVGLLGKGGWVNIPMMKTAIGKAGLKCESHSGLRPHEETSSLLIVKWEGPWSDKPPQVQARYRHWVASRMGLIWDSNWPSEWMTMDEWKKKLPALIPKKATHANVDSVLLLIQPEPIWEGSIHTHGIASGSFYRGEGHPRPPVIMAAHIMSLDDREETFMEMPDRWLADPHWRCENGHVSTTYLKSEEKGSLCLECGKNLWATFPEDKDD